MNGRYRVSETPFLGPSDLLRSGPVARRRGCTSVPELLFFITLETPLPLSQVDALIPRSRVSLFLVSFLVFLAFFVRRFRRQGDES